MDSNTLRKAPNTQKKYRKSQAQKGLVRFEIQVNKQTKMRFDALVAAVADEYAQPWSMRQRLAKARAQVFDEITSGVLHEFFSLKDQIEALKSEIKALSPSFFKTDEQNQTPLPEAIAALPDDPEQLKPLLARLYRESQQALRTAQEQKRRADQFEKLYEAATSYNEELESKLEEA